MLLILGNVMLKMNSLMIPKKTLNEIVPVEKIKDLTQSLKS